MNSFNLNLNHLAHRQSYWKYPITVRQIKNIQFLWHTRAVIYNGFSCNNDIVFLQSESSTREVYGFVFDINVSSIDMTNKC